MTHDDEMKTVRSRNVRTGLILAGLVLALFVSFIVRTWYMRGG